MAPRMRLEESASDRHALVMAGAFCTVVSRPGAAGWMEGEWHDINESAAGTRRRHDCRLIALAKNVARRILLTTAATIASAAHVGIGRPHPGWTQP